VEIRMGREEKICIGGIIICLVFFAIYSTAYYNSSLTKTIQIKEKWVKYHGTDAKYLFSDTEGNVYSGEDSLLLWQFDASDRYAAIEEGETYRITTYGWRIRILSWYPNIVKIEKIK